MLGVNSRDPMPTKIDTLPNSQATSEFLIKYRSRGSSIITTLAESKEDAEVVISKRLDKH